MPYTSSVPSVKILNSMFSPFNKEQVVTSFLVEGFPKLLLGQLAKHRVFSISAESSRARPTEKVLQQVIEDPYIPEFTINQRGMAGKKIEKNEEIEECIAFHLNTRDKIVEEVKNAKEKNNISKQDLNRYLEPWMKMSFILSGTEWSNFLKLRCHEDTQHGLRITALMIKKALDKNEPTSLDPTGIYLPFPSLSPAMNIAKCLGVSYANHSKDYSQERAEEMVRSAWHLMHLTPFEHICKPSFLEPLGNFKGFRQLRHSYSLARELDLGL
jgi:hypothetical protein